MQNNYTFQHDKLFYFCNPIKQRFFSLINAVERNVTMATSGGDIVWRQATLPGRRATGDTPFDVRFRRRRGVLRRGSATLCQPLTGRNTIRLRQPRPLYGRCRAPLGTDFFTTINLWRGRTTLSRGITPFDLMAIKGSNKVSCSGDGKEGRSAVRWQTLGSRGNALGETVMTSTVSWNSGQSGQSQVCFRVLFIVQICSLWLVSYAVGWIK